jgi:outer membrane protein OmpA-like peptidoglycan-associated protein
VIAVGSIIKSYPRPEGLSDALFVVEYRSAFIKAGWAIANESTGADAFVLAHYSQQGRNLWARLCLSHDSYQIQVSDAGANDFGKTLSAGCHVAISGLFFDFNQTVLASHPVGDSPSVTVSPAELNGAPGESSTVTATTASSAPGAFTWQIVKENEDDDIKGFKLTASSCAGQTTCTATLHMSPDHPGFAGLQVGFHLASETRIIEPESNAALQQVLASLKKRRSLHIEVQGYTDNGGTDPYTQTLSASQAAAVVAWLTYRGIAAERLTSKGYGKARPVADNGTDEGKAMNRRIEIADPRCVPKRK